MKDKSNSENDSSYEPASQTKPKILVTNDDGIDAEGIRVLAQSMQRIGDVTVVAPASPQSGMSHAMTLGRPLRIQKVYKNKKLFGYSVSGTPVDCVKVAMTHILKDRPDLVVSGINYGSNTAINILYSGTIGAAVEGRIYEIPSIAFSLTTYENADFSYAGKVARQIAKKVLEKGLPPRTLLSVNIPNVPESDIQGIVVTRQGRSCWQESMIEHHDPYGQPYYWLNGMMALYDDKLTDDEYAIRHNYVSVTPLRFDLTNYDFMESLTSWKFKK
ncbi:5'/3'-nucleotidase SurE [Chloroherpeton thalassium]|uniref:5'/3'-nucleotidase SurE n=1 Tax=Chloroherpeton thalassium TaxID=100716 RepID=UPI000674AFC2|nr:5'/3'-nucleotidase SurE [Chloroherpeton thalassium]